MPNLELLADASEVIHYNNPNVPLYIVQADLLWFTNKCAACHWHDDIEILYIVEGHLSYSVNGEIVDLYEKDAIVVNSKQLHYGFSKDGTNCIYNCYVFKPELMFQNQFLTERYLQPVLSAQNVPYSVFRKDHAAHAQLLEILPELLRIERGGAPGYELQQLALLQQFWGFWYECLKPLLEIPSVVDVSDIQTQKRMIVFIQKQYQQKLSIREIAEAGNISRTKCCQLFKKFYHTTPIEYLNGYRLKVSTELLLNPEIPITEIALNCGFNSSSYFAEIFSQKKGCTPREYRKRHAGAEKNH